MMKVYRCVKLDYDDYPVGSSGPLFTSREAAEQYLSENRYYDQVAEDYLWSSHDEYKEWLNG